VRDASRCRRGADPTAGESRKPVAVMTSQAPCEEGTATLQLLRQACVKNRDCRYGGRSSLLSTRLTVKDVLDFASSERAVINGQLVDQSREWISGQIRLFTSY